MTGTSRNSDAEIQYILDLFRARKGRQEIMALCDKRFKHRSRSYNSVAYVINTYKDNKKYAAAAPTAPCSDAPSSDPAPIYATRPFGVDKMQVQNNLQPVDGPQQRLQADPALGKRQSTLPTPAYQSKQQRLGRQINQTRPNASRALRSPVFPIYQSRSQLPMGLPQKYQGRRFGSQINEFSPGSDASKQPPGHLIQRSSLQSSISLPAFDRNSNSTPPRYSSHLVLATNSPQIDPTKPVVYPSSQVHNGQLYSSLNLSSQNTLPNLNRPYYPHPNDPTKISMQIPNSSNQVEKRTSPPQSERLPFPVLFRPSSSGEDEVFSWGLDGQPVTFTKGLDMTRWRDTRPPSEPFPVERSGMTSTVFCKPCGGVTLSPEAPVGLSSYTPYASVEYASPNADNVDDLLAFESDRSTSFNEENYPLDPNSFCAEYLHHHPIQMNDTTFQPSSASEPPSYQTLITITPNSELPPDNLSPGGENSAAEASIYNSALIESPISLPPAIHSRRGSLTEPTAPKITESACPAVSESTIASEAASAIPSLDVSVTPSPASSTDLIILQPLSVLPESHFKKRKLDECADVEHEAKFEKKLKPSRENTEDEKISTNQKEREKQFNENWVSNMMLDPFDETIEAVRQEAREEQKAATVESMDESWRDHLANLTDQQRLFLEIFGKSQSESMSQEASQEREAASPEESVGDARGELEEDSADNVEMKHLED